MIKFLRAKQKTGSYCGPAVFQMLVSVFGLDLDQEAMVDASGARNSVMKVGITLEALAKGLKRLYPELVVWMKMGSKIEEMEELVKKGYLVAVDWQGVFTEDEYGDDEEDRWGDWWSQVTRTPSLKGTQGHYCVVLEVNRKKGYLKLADPYGHYAGQNRFIAIWEFLERWWDDKLVTDARGRKQYVYEGKLMFVVTKKSDGFPASLGLKRV